MKLSSVEWLKQPWLVDGKIVISSLLVVQNILFLSLLQYLCKPTVWSPISFGKMQPNIPIYRYKNTFIQPHAIACFTSMGLPDLFNIYCIIMVFVKLMIIDQDWQCSKMVLFVDIARNTATVEVVLEFHKWTRHFVRAVVNSPQEISILEVYQLVKWVQLRFFQKVRFWVLNIFSDIF